jgi:hypothetical protein
LRAVKVLLAHKGAASGTALIHQRMVSLRLSCNDARTAMLSPIPLIVHMALIMTQDIPGSSNAFPLTFEVLVNTRGISGVSVPLTVVVHNHSNADITIANDCVDASRPFSYELLSTKGQDKITTRPKPVSATARLSVCSYSTGATIVPANSTIYLQDDPQRDEDRPILPGEYRILVRYAQKSRTYASVPVVLSVGTPELALTLTSKHQQVAFDDSIPVVIRLQNVSPHPTAYTIYNRMGGKNFSYVFEDTKSRQRFRVSDPMRGGNKPDTPAFMEDVPPSKVAANEELRFEVEIVFLENAPLPAGKYRLWVEFPNGVVWYRSPTIPLQVIAKKGTP